jgi:hypothetical protein
MKPSSPLSQKGIPMNQFSDPSSQKSKSTLGLVIIIALLVSFAFALLVLHFDTVLRG